MRVSCRAWERWDRLSPSWPTPSGWASTSCAGSGDADAPDSSSAGEAARRPAAEARPARSLRALGQAAQLDNLQAEHQEAVEHAVQGGLVEIAGQHRIHAVAFDPEISEDFTADFTQATGNGDPVPVRRHGASVSVHVIAAELCTSNIRELPHRRACMPSVVR